MEQKFVYLSKAVLVIEQIQKFIIRSAPSLLYELRSILHAYDELC